MKFRTLLIVVLSYLRLRLKTSVFLVLVSVLLQGCAANKSPHEFLSEYRVATPTIESFSVCARFGCDDVVAIHYQQQQWRQIKALFEPESSDHKQERARLGQAVAMMESMTGELVNTSNDLPRNDGWFAGSPQLDCVAESANTTVSLMLLEQQGLLKYHRILYPSHRGLLSLQAPHNAAAIEELDSKRSYVIDSWFMANGEIPVIVTTQKWKAGFDPDL